MKLYDRLIYIGAGQYPALAKLKSLANEVVLVDALDSQINFRLAEAKEDVDVQVVHEVIAKDEGDEVFYQYNIAQFSGLKPIDDQQKKRYPKLKLLSESTVSTTSISSLFSRYVNDSKYRNIILLDVGDIGGDFIPVIYEENIAQQCVEVILIGRSSIANDSYNSFVEFDSIEEIQQLLSKPFVSFCGSEYDIDNINPASVSNVAVKDQRNEGTNNISVLEKELAEKIEDLTYRVTELTEQRDAQIKQSQENKQKAEALQAKVQELDNTLQDKEVARLALQEECSGLSKQLSDQTAQRFQVEAEFKEAKETILNLTEQRDTQAKHHQENKQKAEALQSKVQELDNTLQDKEAARLALQEECSGLSKQLSDQAEQKYQVEAQLKKANETILTLTEQRDNQARLHQEVKQRSEELTAKIQKLENALTEKETAQRSLQEECSSLSKQLSDQTAQRSQVEAEFKEAKETILTLTEQRDNQARNHQKNKQWAEELKSSLDAAKAKYKEFESECNDLRINLKEKSQSLEVLQGRISVLTEELQRSRKSQELAAHTLELNTKLLTKSKLDYEGLQKKYHKKALAERDLQNLIKELHQKLLQAASFYRNFEENYPDLALELQK